MRGDKPRIYADKRGSERTELLFTSYQCESAFIRGQFRRRCAKGTLPSLTVGLLTRAAARSQLSIHHLSHSRRECFHHAYAPPDRRSPDPGPRLESLSRSFPERVEKAGRYLPA